MKLYLGVVQNVINPKKGRFLLEDNVGDIVKLCDIFTERDMFVCYILYNYEPNYP